MYKFEKARTFAVVMAILNFVVAKVFCCLAVGWEGIPLPVTLLAIFAIKDSNYSEYYNDVHTYTFFPIIALIFLMFTIIFALIAYIAHRLSEAEYKWK